MSRQAKRFSHWAHLCNFAPLWVRRCLFRLPARPKDLWHWAHLCNFAPEWDNKCLLRSLAYVNDLRHIVQVLLLAILILVKVSNLSSAVVDYYWRPFDPDRLSSSSLDMVIIMVWQNHSLPFFRQPHCSRSLLKWHNFFANLPYSNGPILGKILIVSKYKLYVAPTVEPNFTIITWCIGKVQPFQGNLVANFWNSTGWDIPIWQKRNWQNRTWQNMQKAVKSALLSKQILSCGNSVT